MRRHRASCVEKMPSKKVGEGPRWVCAPYGNRIPSFSKDGTVAVRLGCWTAKIAITLDTGESLSYLRHSNNSTEVLVATSFRLRQRARNYSSAGKDSGATFGVRRRANIGRRSKFKRRLSLTEVKKEPPLSVEPKGF